MSDVSTPPRRPEPPDWVIPRDGMAATLAALRHGPQTVAYLGLSATAQRDSYRPALHTRLVSHTGQPHRAVNAGVGGVASSALVFLMDDLVLAHRPALCFIEATTGDVDGRIPHEDVPLAVEGIIVKLRAIGCQPCLLHLYRREHSSQPAHPVMDAYERVAAHYGVPSLHVGRHLDDLFIAGLESVDALFRDQVHTTSSGAERTADLVMTGLDHLQFDNGIDPSSPREPLSAAAFGRGRVEAITAAHCATAPGQGRFRLHYPYLSLVPGNVLSYYSDDAALKGLSLIIGPSSGLVRIATAGGTREHQLKDAWCYFDRLWALMFDDPCEPGSSVIIEPLTGELRVIHFFVLPT